MLSPIFNFNVIAEPESVAIKFVLSVAEDALPSKLPINFAAVIFLPDAVISPLNITPALALMFKILVLDACISFVAIALS